MRFLGLIGARGGSKGIPRKNLTDLAGKPLISYTFDEALKSASLDRVVLSTDDHEIASLARESGVEVPFMRPEHLASDTAVMSDVIEHAIDWLNTNEDYNADAIVLLQPTSPLRKAIHIDEAVEIFQKQNADSVISLSDPLEHPWDMVYLKDDSVKFALDKYEDLTNRQDYQRFYYINGAVYITKTAMFREHKNFWGGRVVPYSMDTIESIDVDTDADLIIADCLLRLRHEKEAKH